MKQISLSILALILFAGCTTAIKRENGTYDVPRQIETRSSFGTNQSGMYIANCREKVNKVSWTNWFALSEYPEEKCKPISNYHFAQSAGQGGTIVSSMILSLGIGLGLANSGSTTTASGGAASSSSTSSAAARTGGRR
jgi:hypothetical protein